VRQLTGLLTGVRVAVAAFLLALLALAVAPVLLGWHGAVVLSDSMSPALRAGDVVVHRPAGQLEVGQILVVDNPARPGQLLTHRLVGETADGRLTLQGDANAVADSTPVPLDAVRGRVQLRVPLIGLPVAWQRSGQLAPLGGTAAALLLLLATARLRPPAPRGRHARGRSTSLARAGA
jgi:signal peptidase